MKKIISIILTTTLIITLTTSAVFAATPQEAADALNKQGLFEGTGTGYHLDKMMSREEAVTMFVKILGKEDEAKNGSWDTPFTDVSNWAKPYVWYAYTNGLASGTSSTKFGSHQAVTYPQYLTFVLKALGYKEGEDFEWDKAYELSNKIGLTSDVNSQTKFLRGDAAVVSLGVVNAKNNDGNIINKLPDKSETLPTATEIQIVKLNGNYYKLSNSSFMRFDSYGGQIYGGSNINVINTFINLLLGRYMITNNSSNPNTAGEIFLDSREFMSEKFEYTHQGAKTIETSITTIDVGNGKSIIETHIDTPFFSSITPEILSANVKPVKEANYYTLDLDSLYDYLSVKKIPKIYYDQKIEDYVVEI